MTTTMPKVYCAGPMRNKPAFNFPEFDHVERVLNNMGFEVFSPAARDRNMGFNPEGYDGTEDLSEIGFDLRDALAVDLDWICRNADMVAVLDGWETSSGARAEVATAQALGIPVYYWMDLLKLEPEELDVDAVLAGEDAKDFDPSNWVWSKPKPLPPPTKSPCWPGPAW